MTIYQYCTPEWLAESAIRYEATPKFKEAFKKLTMKMAFRVKADPALGIDRDIIFAAYVNKGDLEKLSSYRNRKNVILVFFRGYW